MRDGMPPRPPRGARMGPPGGLPPPGRRPPSAPPISPAPPARSSARNPYRPYQPYGTRSNLPAPYTPAPNRSLAAPLGAADDGWDDSSTGDWTVQHAAAVKHAGFTLFHGGNAGHLWRADVAAIFGESLLSAGVLMWLAQLSLAGGTLDIVSLVWALLALALPWLLAGPLAVPLHGVAEPGKPMAWLGRARALLALGLIVMHFRTIYPLVYLLLFALSLCGRLRAGLRVAALRTTLAPGEPEKVSDDLFIGAALATVVGPLLATLFFVLVGERIPLVAAVASLAFLISSNSEGFLDALPPQRRAYLLAMSDPEADALVATAAAELLDDENIAGAGDAKEERAQRRRELALPEWYQQGPPTVAHAWEDIRAGLGLASLRNTATLGLVALAFFALMGGGLALLEVGYVTEKLGLASFYLGPLLAAEAAGLTLGALAASGALVQKTPRAALTLGGIGSGLCVVVLAFTPWLPLALPVALLLGLTNALAVGGARQLLTREYLGVERRALTSAESLICALCGLVGVGIFALFYAGAAALGLPAIAARLFAGWPIGVLLIAAGLALLVGTLLLPATLLLPKTKPGRRRAASARKHAASGRRDDALREEDYGPDDGPASSAYPPALDDDWDDYDDERYDSYESRATDSRYGPATGGYSAEYAAYGDEGDEDDGDDDRGGQEWRSRGRRRW